MRPKKNPGGDCIATPLRLMVSPLLSLPPFSLDTNFCCKDRSGAHEPGVPRHRLEPHSAPTPDPDPIRLQDQSYPRFLHPQSQIHTGDMQRKGTGKSFALSQLAMMRIRHQMSTSASGIRKVEKDEKCLLIGFDAHTFAFSSMLSSMASRAWPIFTHSTLICTCQFPFPRFSSAKVEEG